MVSVLEVVQRTEAAEVFRLVAVELLDGDAADRASGDGIADLRLRRVCHEGHLAEAA